MGQIKPIAGILIVFICGLSVGFIVCHHHIMGRMHRMHQKGPMSFHKQISSSMKSQLNLKPEQIKAIDLIIGETLKSTQDYHHNEVRPKMKMFFEKAKKRICSHLDQEQIHKFEKIPPIFGPGPDKNRNFSKDGHFPPPPHHPGGPGFPPPPHRGGPDQGFSPPGS